MNAASIKKDVGEINLDEIRPQPRGSAHIEREELERAALTRSDGRKLRTKGRTATLSTKVRPELIETIQRIATVENKTMVEVIELAVATLDKHLRGGK